jgi:hypothetical protein
MRRSATLLLLSSALLALAGCKSPCRELSELRCECVEAFQRESCLRIVATDEANVEPTEEQLELCAQKLETCQAPADQTFCEFLETDQGKQACGQAR